MSYNVNDWLQDNYPEGMICANCAHWKEALPFFIPQGGKLLERRLCRHAEFYGDAGAGSVTLVGPESDCTGAGTCAFQPSEAYLEGIEADTSCDDFGVRPGLEYPGTLFPSPCAV